MISTFHRPWSRRGAGVGLFVLTALIGGLALWKWEAVTHAFLLEVAEGPIDVGTCYPEMRTKVGLRHRFTGEWVGPYCVYNDPVLCDPAGIPGFFSLDKKPILVARGQRAGTLCATWPRRLTPERIGVEWSLGRPSMGFTVAGQRFSVPIEGVVQPHFLVHEDIATLAIPERLRSILTATFSQSLIKELGPYDQYGRLLQLCFEIDAGHDAEVERLFRECEELGGCCGLERVVLAEYFARRGHPDAAFEELFTLAEQGCPVASLMPRLAGLSELVDDPRTREAMAIYRKEVEKYRELLRNPVPEGYELKFSREDQARHLRGAKVYCANIEHSISMGHRDRAYHYLGRLEMVAAVVAEVPFGVPEFVAEWGRVQQDMARLRRDYEERFSTPLPPRLMGQ
ncbi:MAG: hypothetical protein KDC38_13595 [Planctomycetes bacterium]|nr:hypothetical protein [Planctomycetota bacterium]